MSATNRSSCKLVAPYQLESGLAAHYDEILGESFFLHVRDNFEKLAKRHSLAFNSAADIGCGTGLFARHLQTTRRIPVCAVDCSRAMLRAAARNCRESHVTLLRQDIRSFKLPHKVDLITANFDTLNHLINDDDLRRAFKRIRANLNPGGHLFCDMITNRRPLGRARVLVRRFLTARHRLQQRVRWEPESSLLSITVTIFPLGIGEPVVESHLERAYSPAEIAAYLTDAGLTIRGLYDAATLRPLRRHQCPPRVHVVAIKAAR